MTDLIAVEDARARILALMQPVGREIVALTEAVNRVLAEDVIARRTQPPFAASAMDGYALRHAEVAPGTAFHVAGEAAAGHPFQGEVPEGCALRIFTGAPVPEGLDRVVIQEDVERSGDTIRLGERLDPAMYVRRAGQDFSAGDVVLTAPHRLSPEDVALLAATGVPLVTVHRRPRIALLATGDELALPGEIVPPGSILSSNNFGLAALVETLHARAQILPVAADDADALRRLAGEGLHADLLVTLGGASVGDHDLIRPALGEAGMTLDIYRIAMRPGKPMMAGRIGRTPMLGLPGNPVSAMVCGRLFLAPAIEALSGLAGKAPPLTTAVLDDDLGSNGAREHYMRAICSPGEGGLHCRVFESQDSARLGLLSRANALAVRPIHDPPRPAGSPIDVVLLRS